jgi:hypothetical protein
MSNFLLWLGPVFDYFVLLLSPLDVLYLDHLGQPIRIPLRYLPDAQYADDLNLGSRQGDLGHTTLFGPYDSLALRSIILIAQAEPTIDMAMLSVVAHTTWRQEDLEEDVP